MASKSQSSEKSKENNSTNNENTKYSSQPCASADSQTTDKSTLSQSSQPTMVTQASSSNPISSTASIQDPLQASILAAIQAQGGKAINLADTTGKVQQFFLMSPDQLTHVQGGPALLSLLHASNQGENSHIDSINSANSAECISKDSCEPKDSSSSAPAANHVSQASDSTSDEESSDETAPKSSDNVLIKNSKADSFEKYTLEQLEDFVREFKSRRIELGYTQNDVGRHMGALHGSDYSQTTLSRFEALNLTYNNMCVLLPHLKKWLKDAEAMSKDRAAGHRENKISCKTVTTIEKVVLEKAFQGNPRPTPDDVALIADSLGLEVEHIRLWFCNRRQRERKSQVRLNEESSY